MMSKTPRTAARQPAARATDTPANGLSIDADDVETMVADRPAPAREAVREQRALRPGEFLGRNGEILSIKRSPDTNMFDIPAHLHDPNFTLEWKRFQVFGKEDVVHQVHLAENGWRPVTVQPGSPFAGYYMPADYTGDIIREDLRLMERPIGLTEMVREQERQKAREQMYVNTQRYTSRKGVETPQGFTTQNPNVPAEIRTDYAAGPAPGKHGLPIE